MSTLQLRYQDWLVGVCFGLPLAGLAGYITLQAGGLWWEFAAIQAMVTIGVVNVVMRLSFALARFTTFLIMLEVFAIGAHIEAMKQQQQGKKSPDFAPGAPPSSKESL